MNQHLPNSMHAAALDRFGGVETIKMQTLPMPKVEADEILIRVESAGVGAWDPWEREGDFAKMFGTEPRFPYVLGSEGAGIVAAVGEQVKEFKEGDRVYAVRPSETHRNGFYAEYATVNVRDAALIPDKLTTEQAGVALADAVTGLRGLNDILGMKRGESVMIFGASGGIGHMALQLAKRMGARVFAVASGGDGVTLVKRLGADASVDGHKDDVVAAARKFAPDGLDAALVTAGGEAADKALTAMRNGGRVAYPNGVDPEPKAPSSVTVTSYDGEPDREMIEKLNRMIDAGPFEIHIARTFPLDRAANAHRALNEHYLGKLALRPH